MSTEITEKLIANWVKQYEQYLRDLTGMDITIQLTIEGNNTMTETAYCALNQTLKDMYNMSLRKITPHSKVREIADIRFFCWTILREFTALSILRIGKDFNRNHASVISGLRAHQDQIKVNSQYRNAYAQFKSKFIENINK